MIVLSIMPGRSIAVGRNGQSIEGGGAEGGTIAGAGEKAGDRALGVDVLFADGSAEARLQSCTKP